MGSEPQRHVEAPKRLFRLSADADRSAATCSRSTHRGRNRTLRDSMSVPQLGENAIGDVGEGVGEEPNVCTDVDGNTAARHQFALTRACLLRNAPPVEN